jgi:hypothetical protein
MCVSPGVISLPYSNVARPSAAHVISKIPAALFTPFTRRLDRNAPAFRSATKAATAARNTACWSAESASKSAPKRANQAKVGTLCQRARRARLGALARLPNAVRNSSPEPKISRPSLARSVSASRSPSCHSFVQNHAWVASMTFCGRSRIPSDVISASRRSPSSRCAAARISSGSVNCPLARSVVLDTVKDYQCSELWIVRFSDSSAKGVVNRPRFGQCGERTSLLGSSCCATRWRCSDARSSDQC